MADATTIRLDADTLAALRAEAARLERPVSWVIRHLLRQSLGLQGPQLVAARKATQRTDLPQPQAG